MSREVFLQELSQKCITTVTDVSEIANYCTDWRKRYQTDALAIIRPTSAEQVQEIVRLCKANHIAICTQGGNTGLVGGAVPIAPEVNPRQAERNHVVLLTTKLLDPIEIDPANLTLTAGVGHTLSAIQQAAEKAGFYFPLSLASEGSCTLGGNLASNAGGVAVLKYGNTRELCLGLEFVNAQGDLAGDLRGLRKNNTGYDLRHLLVGSEGTLGIITKACLKIFPKPRAKVVVWANVGNLQGAVKLLGRVQKEMYNELSSYEWMNRESIELVQHHFKLRAPGHNNGPFEHVLMEFTSLRSQEQLTEAVEECLGHLIESEENTPIGLANVFVSQSLSENQAFWDLREHISEAQAKEGLNIKHDIACPVSKLPEFHEQTQNQLKSENLELRPILFGHLGDGNLHYNLSAPQGVDRDYFLNAYQTLCNRIVHQNVLAYGGTISAEHGIGQLKAELLEEITLPSNYATMKAIKQALDPDNLFNPGKILS